MRPPAPPEPEPVVEDSASALTRPVPAITSQVMYTEPPDPQLASYHVLRPQAFALIVPSTVTVPVAAMRTAPPPLPPGPLATVLAPQPPLPGSTGA